MDQFFQSVANFFSGFFSGAGLSIVKALAALVVGLIIASLLVALVRSLAIKHRKLDNAAASFVVSLTRAVLYILVAIVVLGIAGVNTASLIAAFAAVALAISLGLQDTLAGLTNGILIIFTKPFRQGDYVSIDGTEGTVKEIRLFNTKLTTPENLDVIIPNSKVLGANVVNYSAMPLRRIDIDVPVPYDTDVETVKHVLLSCMTEDDRVVNLPAPLCRLYEYGSSALIYRVRCWVPNGEYWNTKFDLNERMLIRLRKNKIEIPFDQMDVRIVSDVKAIQPVEQASASENGEGGEHAV